ncbi:MAG: hypothetical protein AAGA54_03800 [Myxococcota bacterium]
MALDPSQRVTRRDSLPEGLELSPQDYFLLSRVEGSITVGDLVLSSGMPKSDANAIVQKLLDGGALVTSEAPKAPVRHAASSPSRSGRLRAAAETRRRNALAAALRTSGRPPSTGETPVAEETPGPTESAEASEAAKDELERIERRTVDGSDARIDDSLPIDVGRQRWILAMADGHESMSQFDILGILPTHDVKAIKRAFHETSRALHPDAYHGRGLGDFKPILASLFREAKAAYAELRREDVRAPWVDRRIEDEARARKIEEDGLASERAQREAEAADRREARAKARADRQRAALQSKMHDESAQMLADAEAAEKAGNLARASNLYLLASRADPGNEEIAAKWEAVRRTARQKRGAEVYHRAQSYLDLGQSGEALPLLLEAADADPTAEHLAHAAFAVRTSDAAKARNLAMGALEALRTDEINGVKRKPKATAKLHIQIGYAFLAVGQISTAQSQANLAAKLRPDDQDVRALLKACKAK